MKTIENQIKEFVSTIEYIESSISILKYDLESTLDVLEDSRANFEIIASDTENDLVSLLSQFVDVYVSKYPLQTWKNRIESELHRLRINEIKCNEEKV